MNVSNFAKAVRRVGEIWLGMARELYVEPDREMKTVGASEEIRTVRLGEMGKDPKSGAAIAVNDLTRANFDVAVTVGPSSSSRRKATVRALIKMLQVTQDPETAQVIGSTALMNMEGEGITEVREFFRKRLVQMGAMKPTDEEAQEMAAAAQNQGPDPNVMLASAMAQEAEAKATKARADAIAIAADVEKTRAETLKILSDVQAQARELAMKNAQALSAVPTTTNIPPASPGA